jgi:para-aminobenzoate synthetase/4-amino-4-deoxychorismate lyase
VTPDGRARVQASPAGDSNDNKVLQRFSKAVLKVAPDAGGAPVAAVALAPIDPELVLPGWDRGVELAPLLVPGGIGAHKWADRRLLAGAEADAAPRVPLLLDEDGEVLEASRGNLFAVYEGVLCTPPADGRILPGITRSRVLRIAAALGMPVREGAVVFERLAGAAEVFLTGAIRGIEPVRACDGVFAGSEPRMTSVLSRELRRWWRSDHDQPGGGAPDAERA